jgi:DNA-binding XRE family transcriptional regulator
LRGSGVPKHPPLVTQTVGRFLVKQRSLMVDYRNLSEILFFNRRKKKISQTELAKSANVSRNYISAIERGNIKNVSIGVFFSICAALDLVVEVHKENSTPVLVRCNCGKPADRDGVQCDDCFIRENT